MTSLSRTLSATTLAAALVAAFSGLAWSQGATPASAAPAHRHEADHAHGMKHGERGLQAHEKRLAELKTQLQLTPAQEGAWNQFAEAMRPAGAMQRPDHDALMKLPTPERIDQMRAMRQQHMAQMDRRAEATKAFYATLTPEQKKRFDDQTARMMARHGGMEHGGHHGHHGRAS